MEKDRNIKYSPEPTPAKFHASRKFARYLQGPVGSGKSVACTMEAITRCMEQRPFQNVRRSIWAIIRNTFPRLLDTTIKTFCHWVPLLDTPNYKFVIKQSPRLHGELWMMLEDRTEVEAEFIFLACDSDASVGQLKSMELTGVWINESSEIPLEVFRQACQRCKRFPPKDMGGYNWTGVIMDSNPPSTRSWLYELVEVKRPQWFEAFKQPPAVLRMPGKKPEDPPIYVPNTGQVAGILPAENVLHQNAGFNYWLMMTEGTSEEYIRVFLQGEYGRTTSGKPVYDNMTYRDETHCARTTLEVYRGLPILIGWDFGVIKSACVICQLTPNGQFRVLDELCAGDMGLHEFVKEMVKPLLINKYQGMQVVSVGDPQGVERQATNADATCFNVLATNGIPTHPAPSQNPIARIGAVKAFLKSMAGMDPGFKLSPNCKILREGFNGEYRYRYSNTPQGIVHTDQIEKNEHSHPHDALQYIALWVVQGNVLATGGSGAATAIRKPEVRYRSVAI